MPDYQTLYLTMMRATERSVRILVDAQRACEELYLSRDAGAVPSLSLPGES